MDKEIPHGHKRILWKQKIFRMGMIFVLAAVVTATICAIATNWPKNNQEVAEVESEPEPKEVEPAEILPDRTISENGRTIYLTFDDGPSEHTARLLDVLKEYNVKATFFVTCRGDDDEIRRAYDEGHTVALHTCSHNYAAVYASVAAYFDDLAAVQARVERITGEKVALIRFPGGSSNTVSARYVRGLMTTLTREVTARGFIYFDWNVSSGDVDGMDTADAVFTRTATTLRADRDSVVLQHDTRGYSVDAVARIIEYGIANGFGFNRLSADSETAHHGVNN